METSALGLLFSSSNLMVLSLSETLSTKTTSPGWNAFCGDAASSDVWDYLDANDAKRFRSWLTSIESSPIDLTLQHPKKAPLTCRCQRSFVGAVQLLILTPIQDLQNELQAAKSRGEVATKQLEVLHKNLQESHGLLTRVERIADIGSWSWDVRTDELVWSEGTHSIHGTDPQNFSPTISTAIQFYVEDDRSRIQAAVTKLLYQKVTYDLELQIRRTTGEIIWVRAIGNCEVENRKVIRLFGTFQNIHSQRLAQFEEQSAKRTLELVQLASADGFWDWDLKSNIVRYSDRWKTMLGYGVDELPDGYETWKNLIHPDDFPNTQRTLEEHWGPKRAPYQHTSRFKHKDGHYRTILVKAHTERDSLDRPVRVVGNHTDITDQVTLRQEAKDQAFKISLVMNTLGIGLWDWDIEKNRLEWDAQLFELYQVDKQGFNHSFDDWRTTVDPNYLKEAEERVHESLRTGAVFDHVFKLKPNHGGKFIKGHGLVLRDQHGTPRRLLGINFDVTNEKLLERELTTFKQLAEMSPDIVGLMNQQGQVIFVNDSGARLGWKLGGNARSYFPASSVELFDKTIFPALLKIGSWEGEVLFKDLRTGEELPVFQRAFLMRNQLGEIQAVATVGSDLRERRRLEAEIERQRLHFINNSKMSALGEMASGMAHEINNPLAILQGSVAVLRMQSETGELSPSSLLKTLSQQERTIERIARIISGLRSFARDGSKNANAPFSVQGMINLTLSFCESRFKNNGIEFDYQSPPEDLQVRGNETQMGQALLNLLNNAYDAAIESESPRIILGVVSQGARIKILVSDSGAAIPPELREKIMEPFFTTKEVGKGTGLGLPIAKGIAEAHGGRLYLDGEAPATTFVIELPRFT